MQAAKNGKITVRAGKLIRNSLNGGNADNASLPAQIFSNQRNDLFVDWISGAIEATVMVGYIPQRWLARDVTIDAATLAEFLFPGTKASSPAAEPVRVTPGGRPKTYNWETALIGLIGKADIDGLGVPDKRGAVKMLAELLRIEIEKQGVGEPVASQLNERATLIRKAIYPDSIDPDA